MFMSVCNDQVAMVTFESIILCNKLKIVCKEVVCRSLDLARLEEI
ncbi:hypothetical protein AGMMS50233_10480 [Endomicrobiia bacterium]|nr:hypothetical protein AGMMS50233_10480 [Endomicrobiia bacterium]